MLYHSWHTLCFDSNGQIYQPIMLIAYLYIDQDTSVLSSQLLDIVNELIINHELSEEWLDQTDQKEKF